MNLLYSLSIQFLQIQFLQTNPRGTINDVLSTWGVPITIALVVLAGVMGVLTNLELIVDKEGRGTRREGILNTVYIMLGVALAVGVIAGIITMTKSINLSI